MTDNERKIIRSMAVKANKIGADHCCCCFCGHVYEPANLELAKRRGGDSGVLLALHTYAAQN
jgi:hypothetical protein